MRAGVARSRVIGQKPEVRGQSETRRSFHIAPIFLARFSARFSFRDFWAGFFFSLFFFCSLLAMIQSLSAKSALVDHFQRLPSPPPPACSYASYEIPIALFTH